MINALLKTKKNPKVFLVFRAEEYSLENKKFYAFPEEACFHIQINNMNLPYENIYKLKIQAQENLKFLVKNSEEETLTFPLSYDENGLFEILFLYEIFGENEFLSAIFSFSQSQAKEFCSFHGKENLKELLQSLDEKAKKAFLKELRKRALEVKF